MRSVDVAIPVAEPPVLLAGPSVAQPAGEHEDRRRFALTIVVPARHESGNVAPLLARLHLSLPCPESTEVLFVDDSDDDTPAVIESVGRSSSLSVRLMHRAEGRRTGGLGGAVAAGIAASTAPWVVVMDADLQHPPDVVAKLVAAATDEVDVVVASRHVLGGDDAGLSRPSRVLVSSGSTWLARRVFRRRLRHVTDPMSGFFAVRREAVELTRLKPRGFKILLEILLTSRSPLRVVEVPFVFADRLSGSTKASVRQGLHFLVQLVRLRLSASMPGSALLRRAVGVGAVGLTGIVVNSAALWVFAEDGMLGLGYLLGAALATQVSTGWNFALVDRLVYRRRAAAPLTRRAGAFFLTNNLALLARLPLLALLVSALSVPYLLANIITLVFAFLTRFGATERFVYPGALP